LGAIAEKILGVPKTEFEYFFRCPKDQVEQVLKSLLSWRMNTKTPEELWVYYQQLSEQEKATFASLLLKSIAEQQLSKLAMVGTAGDSVKKNSPQEVDRSVHHGVEPSKSQEDLDRCRKQITGSRPQRNHGES
jgi:hypothetical protein